MTPISSETSYGLDNDTFIINLKGPIPRNSTVQVQLQFISQLTDTLQGFYRTSYEPSEGDRR